MFLPHVGDEVIVSFLDGDPDRPIVTGRVYNDIRKPPLKLPDTRNTSIIRDHAGNQLVFEVPQKKESVSIYCPAANAGVKIEEKGFRNFTPGHHTSFTLKSSYAVTVGNGYAYTLGTAVAVTRGFWCNFKAGIGLDATVGSCHINPKRRSQCQRARQVDYGRRAHWYWHHDQREYLTRHSEPSRGSGTDAGAATP